MGAFSKRLHRKTDKALRKGEENSVRNVQKVNRALRHRETVELIKLHQDLNRTLKLTTALVLFAAKEAYGYGERRLTAMLEKMNLTAQCYRAKLVSIDDIRQAIFDETGYRVLSSDDVREGVEELERLHAGCTDRIQAFAFIALRDLYGFGKKRLSEFHQVCALFCKKLMEGEMTMGNILRCLEKTGIQITAM